VKEVSKVHVKNQEIDFKAEYRKEWFVNSRDEEVDY